MTLNQNELLSALVDGELQGSELEQTLQLITTNAQAKAQFQRYQYASDVLHGYTSTSQNIGLTDRISAALNDEPAFTTNKKTAQILTFPERFWKQAAGLAIAASVGALTVVGVMTQPQSTLVSPQILAAVAVTEIPADQNNNRWTVGEAEVEDRLNTYLVDHNEYAGASDVFSFARVVSYESEQ